MPARGEAYCVPPELNSLADVQAFVCNQARSLNVPDILHPKLELVVEELFVNIVNHALPRSKDQVEITCSQQQIGETGKTSFCVTLRDWGPPFNPLGSTTPSLEQSIEDRPIGGLGIHFVLQMTDHCSYLRDDESNLFSVYFNTP